MTGGRVGAVGPIARHYGVGKLTKFERKVDLFENKLKIALLKNLKN